METIYKIKQKLFFGSNLEIVNNWFADDVELKKIGQEGVYFIHPTFKIKTSVNFVQFNSI